MIATSTARPNDGHVVWIAMEQKTLIAVIVLSGSSMRDRLAAEFYPITIMVPRVSCVGIVDQRQ